MTLSRKLSKVLVEKDGGVKELSFLLEKYKLLSLLPLIIKELSHVKSEQVSESTIQIESPFPLSVKAIARIKRVVGNDIAPHEVSINASLLSGFKARFRGKIYDGSAERIIKQFINQ